MKILFVTSECAPFSKSGGLADVAFSLPPALKQAGNEINVVTPLYQCTWNRFGSVLTKVKDGTIQLGWRNISYTLYQGYSNGVKIWFIDNQDFFNRPKLYGYQDDSLRFAFFSHAVIDLLPEYDFVPQILHCNDWETALTVIYLKNEQAWRSDLRNIKSVYTIHNIAYQGQFGEHELGDTFGLPSGWYDGGLGYEYEGRRDINLMKGAMLMADAVSTVSPTYARELHYPYFAHGLQGVVDLVDHKLYGILNGIDTDHYNPAHDPVIPYHFTESDRSGKAKCKAEIQKMFGLAQEPDWPVLASVARLVEQKGIELIKQVMPVLMDMGCQLIVFGQGDQKYIDYFNWAKEKWPDQLGFSSDYNEPTASAIFAGADMYLMPSRFEPCGLSQMMAMRYGTVPIVHETGGLKDSVRAYKDFDGIGDGFAFSDYQAKDLMLAVQEAVKLYFGNPTMFHELGRRCMTKDFSWDKSAEQYNRMYDEIANGGDGESLSFESAFAQIKAAYTAIDQLNHINHAKVIRKDYHRVIQIQITGRGEGVLHVKFANGGIEVVPNQHLSKNKEVEFTYKKIDYHITIDEVRIYPQGYAAIAEFAASMKGVNMVADIGNGTMNVLYMVNGRPQSGKMYTEKFGTYQCTLAIREMFMQKTQREINDAIIEEVLCTGTATIPAADIKIIRMIAKEYVEGIFRRLREHGYDEGTMMLYITGGGGCLVKNFGKVNADRVKFVDDICAAAKGYEYLAELQLGGK